jgi:hypothetical protein
VQVTERRRFRQGTRADAADRVTAGAVRPRDGLAALGAGIESLGGGRQGDQQEGEDREGRRNAHQ